MTLSSLLQALDPAIPHAPQREIEILTDNTAKAKEK